MRAKGYLAAILVVVAMAMLITACKCPAPAPAKPESFMQSSYETLEIKAPVEKVFKIAVDPNNLQKFDPGFTVSNIQGQGLGSSYHWNWKGGAANAEAEVAGDSLIVGYVPNQSLTAMCTNNQTFYLLFLANPDQTTKLIVGRQTIVLPLEATEAAKQAAADAEAAWFKGYVNGIKTEAEK